LLLLAGALVLTGCAASQYGRGKALLAEEDYAAAAKALQAALEEEPQNPDILVDLAEAFYHQGELEQAEDYLEQASSLDPGNSQAVLILGLIHEKRADMDAAIAAYRSYAQMSRLGKARRIIKARMDRLIRERIRQETVQAVAREEMLDVAGIPDNTVAVAPFQNLGANRSLDPLQKGLAEMMVTDLTKVPGLQVLERLRMQEMMKEIGLAQTGAVAAATAPRLGKLLGASQVVNGSFADLTEEQLRLDITVARIKTEAVDASEVQGPLEKLFRLQKELTFGLIEEMGIALTDEQRDAIQEIPTESMLAFVAYSRGLDLEDQGETEAAAAAFQEAVDLDPAFEVAQESVERVESAELATAEVAAIEDEVLEAEAEEAEVAGAGTAEEGTEAPDEAASEALERLSATGQNVGAGFIPIGETSQADVRKPVEEVERSGPETATVRIEVSIP